MRRNAVPKTTVHFTCSADIWAAFELLIFDPTRHRTRYGEKSRILEALVKQYVEERTGARVTRIDPGADRTNDSRGESSKDNGATEASI